MNSIPRERHRTEIEENIGYWNAKPVLREIYRRFYRRMVPHLRRDIEGEIVEIGSGIGNLKTEIPGCLCTDIFPHPWIDRVENAYGLSFPDGGVSNLILFDVWHHLEYPGSALAEFHRVLAPGGRLVIFEPAVSLLGLVVYGIFHKEPLGIRQEIRWWAPPQFAPGDSGYYAAQGNAWRVFCSREFEGLLSHWKRVYTKKLSAISYVASGGYSGKKLYPDFLYPLMRGVDRLGDLFPPLFATRLLAVLEKR
jgi:SAM-dependent methyltransferase